MATNRRIARRIGVYGTLGALCLMTVIPFLWMLSTSVKPEAEVLSTIPHWMPSHFQFQNYRAAFDSSPFVQYFFNSVAIAGLETVVDLPVGAMAAFAFARLEFFGKRGLFLVFLATMMVPGEVLLIPNYITISGFGWINTYQGLIVPWLVSVFTIFLMRQYFMSLPQELFDAADMDGCGPMRTLFRIVLPVTKPIWVTTGLIKFVGAWNSFLWVLIVANSPKLDTLPVGLINFSSDAGTVYNQLMAAATFTVLPLLLLFVAGQRYFVEGIARSGIK